MSQQLKEHIREICIGVIEKKKWRPFRDITVDVIEEETQIPILAYIELDSRKITFKVPQDFYEGIDIMRVNDGLDMETEKIVNTLGNFVVLHEHGHHSFCPSDKDGFDTINQGILKAVKGQEVRKEKIIAACLQIQNMFSDTVLNTINSHEDEDKAKFREGLGLCYLLMGSYKTANMGAVKKFFARRTMDKAFNLFVNTNQLLCQTPQGLVGKIQKYCTPFYFGAERKKKQVLDIFTGNEKLTNEILEYRLGDSAALELAGRLRDKNLWQEMAYEYARVMYKYARDENSQLDNSFTQKYKESQSQGSGKSQQSKGKSGKSQGSGSSSGQKKDEKDKKDGSGSGDKRDGKGFDEKDKNEQNGGKGKDLYDQYCPRIPYLTSSPFSKNLGMLDAVYRQRAGKIILRSEEIKPGTAFEIPTHPEEMPLDEFSSKGVDWASTRIKRGENGEAEVALYRKSFPISLPFAVDETSFGLPDLAWIFDSSISMEFEPFEGEGRGDYHHAALAFYSQLNYLESNNLAHLLNYNLINFSYDTKSSGWKNYNEIWDVKRALFDYQGGGTFLDPNALKELRETRKDNIICFMLSDTYFNVESNAEDCLKEIELMKSCGGIGFYLYQMGGHSPFSAEVERIGFPVQTVTSAEDFMNKGIKFAKDLYGSVLEK